MITSTLIQSSALILVILLLRSVFGRHIDPRVMYGLWGLPALRLALPAFSMLFDKLPPSPFSLMTAADKLFVGVVEAYPGSLLIADNLRMGHVYGSIHETVGSTLAAAVVQNADVGSASLSPDFAGRLAETKLPFLAGIDLQLVLCSVWLVGFALLLIWFCAASIRFKKKLMTSSRILGADFEFLRLTRLPVYVSGNASSPCIVHMHGKARIFVPESIAQDQKKLQYAVLHEECHLKQHDLVWSLLRIFLLCAYWFNPLVWVAAVLSKRDSEYACDSLVIKQIGAERRFEYGRILIELSEKKKDFFTSCIAAEMCGSSQIKGRIEMIANRKKTSALALAAILVISAVSVGCTFTDAAESGGAGNAIFLTEDGSFVTTEAADGEAQFPLIGACRLTAGFDPERKNLAGDPVPHYGWDLTCDTDMVYAIADGYWHDYGFDEKYGNWVEIELEPSAVGGNSYYVFYAHLEESVPSKAAEENLGLCGNVFAGEQVGVMGNTGMSTGKHLHIEIRTESGSPESAVDPAVFLGEIVKNAPEAGENI